MNLPDVFAELGIKTNLSMVIFTMALLLARILPVIVLSPVLGGEVVPTEVKIGLGVVLGLVLFPAVADRVSEVPISALPYIALLLKELFIGVALAFIVSMVFEAAQIAGNLIDTISGASMAQVMVPQIGQQVSLFASLKIQLSVVLFLTLNGHHLVIESLADSLLLIPIDQFPRFSNGAYAFFEVVMRSFAELLKIGILLSAPAFIAGFLTDLALGMINRVAPQVQVFFISMSIKPLVTVAMMMIALHLVVDRLGLEFSKMLALFREAIQLLA
jgi:flagellar biosynthetic protein FliR